MKFIHLLLLISMPFYFISCVTQRQSTPYYSENVVDTSGKDQVKVPDLRIQKNDLISIQVYSLSTKPELSDLLYNLPRNAVTSGQSAANACGYLVDSKGNIEYPRLGTIHAEGMTKQ